MGCCVFVADGLALSVIAGAMPPLPKGEALAVRAKFLVSPEALPLGELSSTCETERARPPIETKSVATRSLLSGSETESTGEVYKTNFYFV